MWGKIKGLFFHVLSPEGGRKNAEEEEEENASKVLLLETIYKRSFDSSCPSPLRFASLVVGIRFEGRGISENKWLLFCSQMAPSVLVY